MIPAINKQSMAKHLKGISGLRFALLIALMLFIPISQGGMTSGAFAIWLITTGLLVGLSVYSGLFITSSIDRDHQSRVLSSFSWVGVWLLLTLICLIHVAFKVSITEFWMNGFRGIEVLDPKINFSTGGLMSYARLQTLGMWAFFTALWIVAYVCSRLRQYQVKWVLIAVLIMGAFQAFVGLVGIKGGGTVLGMWQKIHVFDATGTFINRNHFANFIALCLPFGLCALSGDKPLVLAGHPKTYRMFLLAVFVVISVLAALASHSRMGLMVTLVAGSSWLIISQLRTKRRLMAMDWIVLLGSVVLVVLMMLWFGVNDTMSRAMTLADGDGRLQIWKSVFDLPSRVWIFGIGPGNFSEVFALVKPVGFDNFAYYAHSDYLEFVLEFGVPVSALLILSGFIWFKINFHGNILKDVMSVRAAAACAVFVMVLHSLVDFSLQIPANATYAAIALGLLLNQDLSVQVKRKSPRVSKVASVQNT